MSTDSPDRPRDGIQSEDLVKELLQAAGWHVVEARKASDAGRAPVTQSEENTTRLPDFEAQHPAHTPRYVEVKEKGEAIEYGIEDQLRHGVDKCKFDDYHEFAKLASAAVWLFVHERQSGVILRKRLRDLSVVDSSDHESFGGNTVLFFARDQFDVVTDDIGQFSAGFGQDGLIDDESDPDPFDLSTDNDQFGLHDFGGDGQ